MSTLKRWLTQLKSYFTPYERWWFSIIIGLSILISYIYPEEPVNGIDGRFIATLYLTNIFSNALCELLIAKQSKWNFVVSLVVEMTEIAIPIVLAYRFATMAVTLLFWVPIDIISFINWHRHPDQQNEELTEVRKLSGWAEFATIVAIAVWTFGVGYWMSTLNVVTDLFNGNKSLELWVVYLDACVSAVGMANGLFILLRYREQWLAWYLSAALETTINILSGQYVLLVLKAGYFVNTTYGYIKWTRWISDHQQIGTSSNSSDTKLTDTKPTSTQQTGILPTDMRATATKPTDGKV